ncbi:MAG: Serine/threonine-protein kinase PrkC [Planctomycetota bacterium]|jgi:formylglycine-generating enzyme required for sulfatase activity
MNADSNQDSGDQFPSSDYKQNPYTEGPNNTQIPEGTANFRENADAREQVCSLPSRYRIEKRLGRGGMGAVFLATDLGDLGHGTRQVAIKLLLDHLANDSSSYAQFVREMHIAEQLDHENIVQVLTHGRGEKGTPYLVMQYIDGGSLLDRIRQQGALKLSEAIDLAMQLCTALMVAHDRGVIHRDIKPGNILIREERYPRHRLLAKLGDFGLARSLETTLHSMTAQVGTFGYRSPEQRHGLKVDARSDLYGLGATIFHALTGEIPEGIVDWEELPEAMRPLLRRAMSKYPADRFSSAQEMYEALQALVTSTQQTTTTTAVPITLQTEVRIIPESPPEFVLRMEPNLTPPETLTNSLGMEFRLIQAGSFLMGSPKSEPKRQDDEIQHQVTLTHPFYLGIYPVQQKEYERLMGINPSHFRGDDHPVEQVCWDDAIAFIARLNSLEAEKLAGRVYRLPTEAEWEYACRAGTLTSYLLGNTTKVLESYAWYDRNSLSTTHPVGEKIANAWGLHDLVGNVFEWCYDWYDAYPRGTITDPSGPRHGKYRVARGSSWLSDAYRSRFAYRTKYDPSYRNNFLGFRIVFSLKP